MVATLAVPTEQGERVPICNRLISGRSISEYSDMARRSLVSTLGKGGVDLLKPSMTVLPGGVVFKGYRRGGQIAETSKRGVVSGFSKSSRKRLRERLMSLDWPQYDAYFATLTYHLRWSADPSDWKAELRAWLKRVKRRWSGRGYIGCLWRLEFQKRGAPHFHCLLLFTRGALPSGRLLERWVKHSWSAIVGETGNTDHRRHGGHVVKCRWSGKRPDGRGEFTLGSLIGYMVKEMSKVQQNPAGIVGRVWGIEGDADFVVGEEIELTAQEWAAVCWAISQHGERVHSWYLSNVNPAASGFTVIGGRELGALFDMRKEKAAAAVLN